MLLVACVTLKRSTASAEEGEGEEEEEEEEEVEEEAVAVGDVVELEHFRRRIFFASSFSEPDARTTTSMSNSISSFSAGWQLMGSACCKTNISRPSESVAIPYFRVAS